MNRYVLAGLAALLAAFLPQAARAEERIHSFDSQIAILADGALEVTETIRVSVEHDAINHGIFRDFPTRYDAPGGRRVRVGFDLVEARLDGQLEPATAEPHGNGVRVRIGDAEKFVPIGEHEYRLRYRATRMIGRFGDYDELYWNVTGNGWDFPIDQASATIILPSPARFSRPSSYTGPQGSTASDTRILVDEPGSIRFATIRPLAPREGLSIAVAFPKGIVGEPPTTSRMAWFFSDWGPPLVALGGLGALLAFLFYAWRRAGRDPRPGTVVPLFSPPDDLSPAAMRYLVKEKLDNRGFAATLVNAAVRGHVRLVEEDRGVFRSNERRIERLDLPDNRPLSAAEEKALNELVGPNETLVMEQENHAAFSAASTALDKEIGEQFENRLFKRNHGWAVLAVLVWGGAFLLTSMGLAAAETGGSSALVPLTIGGLVLAALLWFVAPAHSGAWRYFLRTVAILVGIAGVLAALPAVPQALASGRWVPLGLAAIGLPFALSSFGWISAPTAEGRAILDRIAGFKQYLSITERERLDRMQAPEDSLQLFERYLPYAIALDVENRWADRFTSLLAAASAASGSSSAFAWYSGSSSPWSDTGGFVDSLGSSLASTISSASTAPGSSSGSGGGGFSGGGGGGGGGGGW